MFSDYWTSAVPLRYGAGGDRRRLAGLPSFRFPFFLLSLSSIYGACCVPQVNILRPPLASQVLRE